MISIIIPTLNEEKIIEKTLTLLRGLTNFEYEVIVSDGKSKDKTIEISKKYANKVVIYEGKERQTISMGRNLGVSAASGDILLFIDADIVIPNINNFFKETLSYFKNNPECVALTVPLKVFPEMETFWDKIFYGLINKLTVLYNNILHTGGDAGEFQMIKKNAFDKVGGFNEKLAAGEDFEMFAKVAKIGKVRTLTKLFVYHTGRRPHKVGWKKVLYSWLMNSVYAIFFKKSWSKTWDEVR